MEKQIERVRNHFSKINMIAAAVTITTEKSDKSGYDWKIAKLGSNVISKEYIKSAEEVTQDGSYLQPIPYVDGMAVTKDLWYSLEDGNIWQCIKTGETSEMTSEYFDILEG